MDYLLVAVAALIVTASSIGVHLLTRAKKPCPAKLPPGSLGLPVIGQTIGLVRAMRANSVDRWIQERIDRYGLVSKLSLFCTPAVLLAGTEANQFVFFCSLLPVWRPRSFQRIIGEKNMMNLYGDDHRRIHGAVMELLNLKHDMHRLYVRRMDSEVRRHLEKNWAGRTPVTVLPLMKRLALDIICALLFGLEPGAMRDSLAADLVRMLEGTIAIPVNLPFTAFGRSLKASGRVRRLLSGIVREKKAKLEQGKSAPTNDLISRLLCLTDNQGQQLLTNDEIVDNSMLVLLSGHDTTSLLMTFMVRHLANDPDTLAAMVQEHEEIARNKAAGEALTWEDLAKMNFTWQVAQETFRIVPPAFASLRIALDDIEFDGYRIPKGWLVFLAASATHMDPSIYHEPDKFDPSHFDNYSLAAGPPCSNLAFGCGHRICPGIVFAKIEILVMMHYLVRHFRWKLCCKENTFAKDPLPSPLLHGLPIQIEHMTYP